MRVHGPKDCELMHRYNDLLQLHLVKDLYRMVIIYFPLPNNFLLIPVVSVIRESLGFLKPTEYIEYLVHILFFEIESSLIYT